MLWILHQRKLTLVCVWSTNLCISMVGHWAVPGWDAVLFHQEIRHSRPVTAAVLQFTATWFLSAVNSMCTGDWKLIAENFVDFYHIDAVHPELSRLRARSATFTSMLVFMQTKLQVFSSWWPSAISRLHLGHKSVAFLTYSYTLLFLMWVSQKALAYQLYQWIEVSRKSLADTSGCIILMQRCIHRLTQLHFQVQAVQDTAIGKAKFAPWAAGDGQYVGFVTSPLTDCGGPGEHASESCQVKKEEIEPVCNHWKRLSKWRSWSKTKVAGVTKNIPRTQAAQLLFLLRTAPSLAGLWDFGKLSSKLSKLI